MPRDGDDPFIIEGLEALKETPKALLVKGRNLMDYAEEEEVWIPRSVIHDDSEIYEVGHQGRLAIKRWFARKQGWTDD